jgi:ferredoxin
VHVTVDTHRCVGSTLCVHFAPGCFELDESLQARVCPDVQLDRAAVLEAAEQCPQSAITVTDATGRQLFPPVRTDAVASRSLPG